MVNRYITALLVVLAATGMEAQTYQSAMRLVLADIPYEQVCLQPEAKALADDILAVIKALKQANDQSQRDQEPSVSALVTIGNDRNCNILTQHISCNTTHPTPLKRFFKSGIVIRGPDCNDK